MNSILEYEIDSNNVAELFARQAEASAPPLKDFAGKGFVICAGGPYLESAYVVVCLLRHYGATLPIEVWHAGADEIPDWARPAFIEHGVVFHDIMEHCKNRSLKQMRGFPIKTAAILNTQLREVMFIDADCFPVCNLEFLFETQEYRDNGAVFFPDYQRHFLLPGKPIWDYVGMPYNGDTEFETGLLLCDKVSCWKALNLTEWMNMGSGFWYHHTLGDKDTFYLAWRKVNQSYFLAPDCTRIPTVLSRHYWTKKKHLVDHRTGTSKYTAPYKKGIFTSYLSPYKGRSTYKDVLDEYLQRFVNRNYSLHTQFLDELKTYKDSFES